MLKLFFKIKINKVNKIYKKTFIINENDNLVFCLVFQFLVLTFANQTFITNNLWLAKQFLNVQV